MDHLTPEARSRNMAAIKSRDTVPELRLRRALREAGLLGYRVSPRALPGKPDIAFTRWRVAVFVDGAYWHGHPDHFREETASEYWRRKITKNRARDAKVDSQLRELGWTVLRFWDFDILHSTVEAVASIGSALTEAGRRIDDVECASVNASG